MYLNGVEINGFKSFGDRKYIEFDRGITSIVGPNGSGKSNILDAVIWVLGELSYKNIRAKESQDVIYSGKKNINRAEVSLHINNEDRYLPIDNDKVKITRRLSKDNESEYLINDMKVRLRDVLELFTDTGIGKSAYSIIGQGKVERIINSNPKELRSIIEEAAGIKKIQLKRTDGIKNLKDVEDKLSKVELVLNEVRENRNNIEKQAVITRKYLNLKNDRDVLNKSINLTELKHFENLIEEYKIKLEKAKQNLHNFTADFEAKESRINEIENEKFSLSEEISKLNSDNSILKSIIDDEQLEKVKLTEELKHDVTEKGRLEEEISQDNRKIDEKNDEIEKNVIEENKLRETIDRIKKDKEEYEIKLNQLTDERDILNNEVNVKIDLIKEKEIEKIRLIADVETAIKKKKASLSEIMELKKELDILNENSKANSEEELFFLTKKNNKEEVLKNVSNNLEKVENLISDISVDINKLSTQISTCEYDKKITFSKLEALEKTQENNEGFYESVKKVLNSGIKGINGALISLIKFDSKFIKIFETSAVGNLQDIVVDNSETAKEAIEFLKNNKYGRASFIPLDNIKANKKYFDVKRDKVYGILSDLLSYEKKYKNAIDFAFGNILVVEDIDTAIAINKENIFAGNIVTLSGDTINKTGRMTGGEYSKSNIGQIISRKKEIEEYKDKYSNIEKDLQKLTKERDEKISKLENLEDEVDKLSDKEEELNKELKAINESYEEVKSKAKKLINEISKLKIDIEDEERYYNNYEEKISQSESEETKLNKYIDSINNDIKEEKSKIEIIDEKILKLNEKFSDIRVQFLNSEDKIKNISDNRIKIKNDISEITSLLSSKKEKLEAIHLRIENNSERNSFLEESIKNKLEQYRSENKDIEALAEKEKELLEEERTLLKDKSNIETYMLRAKDEVEKNISTLKKFDEDILSIREELEKLEHIEADIFDTSKLKSNKEKYRRLSIEVDNFGNVNLLAIDEFNRLNEKYEFMCKERDDIVISRKSLLNLIEELDIQILDEFNKAYNVINENFNKMCSETIDNTEGRLELINMDSLENAGIEIIVKFKNKKRQTLSLLSGGEKSMVAVSFIMAIFMYKPSPFTFLDEIEAALDKKNIVKLINKLKEFTDKSQFIMITHNDQTMYESDRIIGISMDKNIGISQVQYLNFNDR